MSKLDAEKILPDNPLQDGDKISTVKKYVNKYEFAIEWLLHESFDHKKVTIDSDTNWDDLKNLSSYYFNSLDGPNAPEESQLGSHTGVVFCSSAGIGGQFQFAFTGTGACFRDTRDSWFYIGHGIPSDVDISKLVDQETLTSQLASALKPYYTKPEVNELINRIYKYIPNNYYDKSYINSLQADNQKYASGQDTRIGENHKYITVVRSSMVSSINSVASSDSAGISSLSSSTSSSTTALSSSDNSALTSLSTSTSSSTQALSQSTSSASVSQYHYTNQQVNYLSFMDSISTSSLSSSTSSGIYNNSINVNTLFEDASELNEYGISLSNSTSVDYESLSLSTSDNSVYISDMDSMHDSISNSNYLEYELTSSSFSTNESFATDPYTTYDVLGDANNGGLNSSTDLSDTNSLASLNYQNTSVLASYVFDATHWGSASVASTSSGRTDFGIEYAYYLGGNNLGKMETDSPNTNMIRFGANCIPASGRGGYTAADIGSCNPIAQFGSLVTNIPANEIKAYSIPDQYSSTTDETEQGAAVQSNFSIAASEINAGQAEQYRIPNNDISHYTSDNNFAPDNYTLEFDIIPTHGTDSHGNTIVYPVYIVAPNGQNFTKFDFYADSSVGRVVNPGLLGKPLKEQVQSNTVMINSLVAQGSYGVTYPLVNYNYNYNSNVVQSESLSLDQKSGNAAALGSIYANTSAISVLADAINSRSEYTSYSTSDSNAFELSSDYAASVSIGPNGSSYSYLDNLNYNNANSLASSNASDIGNALSNIGSECSELNEVSNSVQTNNSNIAKTTNVLEAMVGSLDDSGIPEEDSAQILCTAYGANTNAGNREGRIIGDFTVLNPRLPNHGPIYNLSELESCQAPGNPGSTCVGVNSLAHVNSGNLSSFPAPDKCTYQTTWDLSQYNIYFDKPQTYEMACRMTSSPQEEQNRQVSYLSKALASAVANPSSPFGSAVVSTVSSMVSQITPGSNGYNPYQ